MALNAEEHRKLAREFDAIREYPDSGMRRLIHHPGRDIVLLVRYAKIISHWLRILTWLVAILVVALIWLR